MPEAQAAYFYNYNNGEDSFGRIVTNPAGVDLTPAVAADLGLVYLQNDWVTVTYLWEETQSPPSLTITSPTDGTVWYVDETHSITWTVSSDASHINYFILGYSIDGGNNYDLVNGVNSTTPGTARTYSWTVPNTPSTQCKILIGAIDANGITLTATESDGLFTIAQAIDPLSITTSSLPSGTQNQFYSASFSATGGTTPYIWSRSSGIFPSGLSLSFFLSLSLSLSLR
jgi:hypothetical protein